VMQVPNEFLFVVKLGFVLGAWARVGLVVFDRARWVLRLSRAPGVARSDC